MNIANSSNPYIESSHTSFSIDVNQNGASGDCSNIEQDLTESSPSSDVDLTVFFQYYEKTALEIERIRSTYLEKNSSLRSLLAEANKVLEKAVIFQDSKDNIFREKYDLKNQIESINILLNTYQEKFTFFETYSDDLLNLNREINNSLISNIAYLSLPSISLSVYSDEIKKGIEENKQLEIQLKDSCITVQSSYKDRFEVFFNLFNSSMKAVEETEKAIKSLIDAFNVSMSLPDKLKESDIERQQQIELNEKIIKASSIIVSTLVAGPAAGALVASAYAGIYAHELARSRLSQKVDTLTPVREYKTIQYAFLSQSTGFNRFNPFAAGGSKTEGIISITVGVDENGKKFEIAYPFNLNRSTPISPNDVISILSVIKERLEKKMVTTRDALLTCAVFQDMIINNIKPFSYAKNVIVDYIKKYQKLAIVEESDLPKKNPELDDWEIVNSTTSNK